MAWFDQRFIVVLRPFPCNSTAIRSIDAPSCDSIRFEANDFLLSWKKKTHENGTKQFESIKKKHSMKRASTRSSPTLISSMRPIGKHFWRSRSDDVITRSTHFHPLSTPFPPPFHPLPPPFHPLPATSTVTSTSNNGDASPSRRRRWILKLGFTSWNGSFFFKNRIELEIENDPATLGPIHFRNPVQISWRRRPSSGVCCILQWAQRRSNSQSGTNRIAVDFLSLGFSRTIPLLSRSVTLLPKKKSFHFLSFFLITNEMSRVTSWWADESNGRRQTKQMPINRRERENGTPLSVEMERKMVEQK